MKRYGLYLSMNNKVVGSLRVNPIHIICVLLMLGSGLLVQAEESDLSEHPSICINTIRTENFELAKDLCHQQLKQAQLSNDSKSELSLLLALLDIYKQTDDDAFDDYLIKVEKHPLFESSPQIKYQWLRLQAIKLHHAAKFKSSNAIFLQALQIAIMLNDEIKISNSNIDLGISATAVGEYKTALNHYRTSLELTREMNDPYATGLSLKSVGNVYLQLEEYPDAIKYFEEALNEYAKYMEQSNYDSRVQGRINSVYKGLVEAHQKSNNLAAAKKYQLKIEQSKSKNNHDRANQLVQQAKQLIDLEDYHQATTQLTQALHLYQAEGIESPSEVLYLLAKAYHHSAQFDLAIYYALEGIKNTEDKQSNHSVTSQNYQLLSQLYTESDPKLALTYAIKYNQARESFLATKYNTDLKTIQHQIELEKNQNKLVTSQLKNTQQQVKIQTLNNKYLISLLVLLCLFTLIIYLNIKKKREQSELKATINYHKNQFAVLSLSTQPQKATHNNTNQQQIKQDTVNQQLVAIMHDAINLWVEHTGDNLIELADRSRIWTITNDNGTLRARSLEKYLSLQKIPQNPRWRNVVRTCHFVLSEVGLGAEQRQQLNLKLESLMQMIKDYYGTGK